MLQHTSPCICCCIRFLERWGRGQLRRFLLYCTRLAVVEHLEITMQSFQHSPQRDVVWKPVRGNFGKQLVTIWATGPSLLVICAVPKSSCCPILHRHQRPFAIESRFLEILLPAAFPSFFFGAGTRAEGAATGTRADDAKSSTHIATKTAGITANENCWYSTNKCNTWKLELEPKGLRIQPLVRYIYIYIYIWPWWHT